MSKTINHIKLDETISITECTDGWWLYDTTRGMNLSLHAKTKDAAFFEALKYYQKRLIEHEKALKGLRAKVLGFVEMFVQEVDYDSSSDIPSTILEINI